MTESRKPVPIPVPDIYNYARRRPVCRFFLKDQCKKGDECRFAHPPFASPYARGERKRKIGKCYCGSSQMTLMNGTKLRDDGSDLNAPCFFIVCGKTKRSMKKCL